jgi:hypothetical protein
MEISRGGRKLVELNIEVGTSTRLAKITSAKFQLLSSANLSNVYYQLPLNT